MSATTPDRNAPVTGSGRAPKLPAVEIGTLILIVAAYGAWLAVTFACRTWPLWVVAPAGAVLLTLHSSLQHEILHGHPTRWRGVNTVLGVIPLSLWLPYRRYRDQHLTHHINDRLTDPHDDPETCYWDRQAWDELSSVGRGLVWVQQTLAGRVLIGPFWRIPQYLGAELRAVVGNEGRVRAHWGEHLLWCVPVVVWVQGVCGVPLWLYALVMVAPGNGILLIRSFAEHRARPVVSERTAVVERPRILGPLFLYNNLHSLHHDEPMLPWYQYNARYRERRDELLRANAGLRYDSYLEVARRFMFRPHDVPVHPMGGIPQVQRVTAAALQAGTA